MKQRLKYVAYHSEPGEEEHKANDDECQLYQLVQHVSQSFQNPT